MDPIRCLCLSASYSLSTRSFPLLQCSQGDPGFLRRSAGPSPPAPLRRRTREGSPAPRRVELYSSRSRVRSSCFPFPVANALSPSRILAPLPFISVGGGDDGVGSGDGRGWRCSPSASMSDWGFCSPGLIHGGDVELVDFPAAEEARCDAFALIMGGVGSGSHPLLWVWLEVGRRDVFGRRRRHLCSPGGWLRRRRRLVLHLCERGGSFQYSPSAGPGFRPLASPAVADCCS